MVFLDAEGADRRLVLSQFSHCGGKLVCEWVFPFRQKAEKRSYKMVRRGDLVEDASERPRYAFFANAAHSLSPTPSLGSWLQPQSWD